MAALLDIVKKGSVDRSVTLRIVDSGDGTPETGVVFNTGGIDLWYRRELAAKTSITEATLAALTTAHADGGFLHIGDGEYRLDLPDAAFASGANHVDIGGTVTGMVVIGGRVRLVGYDPEDAVRLGLSDVIADGALTAAKIATAALTAAKFAANSIEAAALAADVTTELQAGLATAAAIAALNNLSSAQAQTAAAAALTAYDAAVPGDVPTAAQNAAALLDLANAIDTYTPRQALRLMLALLTGEITFAGNVATIKAADGSKTRATFETNAQEERLNGVLDAT